MPSRHSTLVVCRRLCAVGRIGCFGDRFFRRWFFRRWFFRRCFFRRGRLWGGLVLCGRRIHRWGDGLRTKERRFIFFVVGSYLLGSDCFDGVGLIGLGIGNQKIILHSVRLAKARCDAARRGQVFLIFFIKRTQCLFGGCFHFGGKLLDNDRHNLHSCTLLEPTKIIPPPSRWIARKSCLK